MSKRTSKKVVMYKPLSAENDSALKTEYSWIHFFSSSYSVEFTHNGTDVGLPIYDCGDKHYIVGTLIVTESGINDKLQKNRLVGQTLILPQCSDGRMQIYTRTLEFAAGN